MYLSLASVVLLVVILGYVLIRGLGSLCGWSERVRAGIAVAALLLLSGTLTALTVLRNEDYRTATALYEDTVRKNPACARELYNLSLDQSGDDDLTPAIENCDRALAIYPDDVLSLRHRGRLAFTVGDFRTAIASYERVFQDTTKRLDFHLSLLGRSYRAVGNRTRAIESLRLAADSDAKSAYYRLELAAALDEDGQKEEARKELKEALRLAKEQKVQLLEEVHRGARRDAVSLPRPDRPYAYLALFQARQAVLGDGDNPRYLDTLAIAEAANGQFPEAIRTAERALRSARARDETELAKQIRRRIGLFKRDTPYRIDTAR